MKLDYHQLLVNENAYFYKVKRPLVKRDIELIFQEAVSHKKAIVKFETRLRESYIHGGKEIAKVSVLVYEFKKRPSFLTKDVKNTLEIKYGLFVIIESDDFIGTIRKNVSGIDSLYSLTEKIDHNTLARFQLGNKTKFEKIVTDNMNAASNAIHRKTSEGNDLKNTYSRFSASKQIIKRVRLEEDGKRTGISITTSRVNSFSVQKELEPSIIWIVEIIAKLKTAYKKLPSSNFIDSFATPVEFDSMIDDLTPSYLILRFDTLKDDIDDSRVVRIVNKVSGKKVDLDKEIFAMERLYELKEDGANVFINGAIQARIRPKSIFVRAAGLSDLILKFENGSELTLNDYINRHHHFLIIFDKLDHVYSHGTIFKDNRLLGDTKSFLSTFIPFDELREMDSEKGRNYKTTSTEFGIRSLFRFTETVLCKDSQFLVCDDMSTEWGDFISIDQNEIGFYHLKYKEQGFSASNLQDVFGQLQKNFGVLSLTEELLELRRNKWGSNYRIENVTTSISRIRRTVGAKTFNSIKAAALEASSNVNVRKRVIVVVNFISKSELEKMLEKLKSGKSFQSQGVTLQLLWFVHGVLALAQELGAEFKIICRP